MRDSWRLGFLPNGLISGVALCLSILLIGCTRLRVTGHPPQHVPGPPLSYIRGPVDDLAAVRAENHVSLTWTMPRKSVDRLTVNGSIAVRVWRGEERTDLTEIGDAIYLAPGTTGSFSEELPEALSSGRVRPVYYFVDLLDRAGRSTGLSDYVPTIAGGPPLVVQGLTAEMAETGVLIRWNPHRHEKSQSQWGFAYVESCFFTGQLMKNNGYRHTRHWNKTCSLRTAHDPLTHWIRMSNTATRMTTELNTSINSR
jgi:hypothetical protein